MVIENYDMSVRYTPLRFHSYRQPLIPGDDEKSASQSQRIYLGPVWALEGVSLLALRTTTATRSNTAVLRS